MSYGSREWQSWLLDEKESLEHIKYAYDHGINAFDTANVYSDGRSEEILGKAIKELNMNRDEIVIMTCVCLPVNTCQRSRLIMNLQKAGRYSLARRWPD